MNLLSPRHLFALLTGQSCEDEEDRADSEYIRMAKHDNDTFRPLREVLAEIEKKERGELHGPVKQAG